MPRQLITEALLYSYTSPALDNSAQAAHTKRARWNPNVRQAVFGVGLARAHLGWPRLCANRRGCPGENRGGEDYYCMSHASSQTRQRGLFSMLSTHRPAKRGEV